MRNSKINQIVKSNSDLTILSNSRIIIKKIESETFFVTSSFNIYKSEAHSFVYRFIKSRLKLKFITGNSSTPTGYYI